MYEKGTTEKKKRRTCSISIARKKECQLCALDILIRATGVQELGIEDPFKGPFSDTSENKTVP